TAAFDDRSAEVSEGIASSIGSGARASNAIVIPGERAKRVRPGTHEPQFGQLRAASAWVPALPRLNAGVGRDDSRVSWLTHSQSRPGPVLAPVKPNATHNVQNGTHGNGYGTGRRLARRLGRLRQGLLHRHGG